jgi:RNA polymerase sigma-70 factor (ECF subfamily)
MTGIMTSADPDARSDRDLLNAWIAGDERAFDDAVSRHQALVRKFCRRHAPGESIDDAVQAVFIVLARRPQQALRAPALEAWLLRTAWLVCQQLRRNHAVRKRIELASVADLPPTDHDARDPDGVLAQVDAAMQRLPERQRAALTLQFIAGRSQAEIAEQFGMQPNAVKQLIHRGLTGLRNQLRSRGVRTTASVLVALFAAARASAAADAPDPPPAGDPSALADSTIRADDLAEGMLRRQALRRSLEIAATAAVVVVIATATWFAWPRADRPMPPRPVAIATASATPTGPVTVVDPAAPPKPPARPQATPPAAGDAGAKPVQTRMPIGGAHAISIAEANALMARRRVLILDCAGTASYACQHLPGAIDVEANQADFGRFLPNDRSAPVIIYGATASCTTFEPVAVALIAAGYHDVRFLDAGLYGWLMSGGRVETKAGAP